MNGCDIWSPVFGVVSLVPQQHDWSHFRRLDSARCGYWGLTELQPWTVQIIATRNGPGFFWAFEATFWLNPWKTKAWWSYGQAGGAVSLWDLIRSSFHIFSFTFATMIVFVALTFQPNQTWGTMACFALRLWQVRGSLQMQFLKLQNSQFCLNAQVLRFLLSNLRWWIEERDTSQLQRLERSTAALGSIPAPFQEYGFDGFRFGGVTSMLPLVKMGYTVSCWRVAWFWRLEKDGSHPNEIASVTSMMRMYITYMYCPAHLWHNVFVRFMLSIFFHQVSLPWNWKAFWSRLSSAWISERKSVTRRCTSSYTFHGKKHWVALVSAATWTLDCTGTRYFGMDGDVECESQL